eukprot:1104753-Prorocentrum_minimum.AAC.1
MAAPAVSEGRILRECAHTREEDQLWDKKALPEGVRDVNGQQLDLRARNSWLLKMEEVSPLTPLSTAALPRQHTAGLEGV